MGRSKKLPVKTRKVSVEDNSYWMFHDDKATLIEEAIDYFIFLTDDQQCSQYTVDQTASDIKLWYQYLSIKDLQLLYVDDDNLKDFRNWLTERRAINSSGDKRTRKRTTNATLRHVYSYYVYLQDMFEKHYLIGTVGCQITSSLSDDWPNKKSHYPLCFKGVGERSKHGTGFVPLNRHRMELQEYFYETNSNTIAQRNCLIMDIAWEIGWRRGSILSLRCAQFEESLLIQAEKTETDHLLVIPDIQKFGYCNSFKVPLTLCWRIWRYIIDQQPLLSSQKTNNSSIIFLSTRGTTLSPSTVSHIFGNAAKALGWPRGAALHAWRRSYVNNEIEAELDARLELGFDTSLESISMSIARKMGHQSPSSQAAYVRDTQRRIRGTTSYRDKSEINRLTDVNARLQAELIKLRRMLEKKH